MQINEKALEAACSAFVSTIAILGDQMTAAIRAYLTSATPSDVADSEEEARIDDLRLRAFRTNAEQDRQAYFDAASKWFQDRHFRRMEAATALRLSAGGGWRTMDSAPKDGTELLIRTDDGLISCRWDEDANEWSAGWLGIWSELDRSRAAYEHWGDTAMEQDPKACTDYIKALEAENARMREALEPFSKESKIWAGYDDAEVLCEGFPNGPRSLINVGHLRAARRASEGGNADG